MTDSNESERKAVLPKDKGLLLKSMGNSSIEKTVYITILSCAALASVTHVLSESAEDDNGATANNSSRILGPGWRWISRRQDIADFEWTFWLSNLREYVLLALFGHAIFSLLSAHFFPMFTPILQSIFCVYCLRAILGLPYVLLVTAHCTIFFATAATQSTLVCWILTVANLLFLHLDTSQFEVLPTFLEGREKLIPLAYSGLAFSTLRCCSFIMERHKSNPQKERTYDLSQLIQYNLYLPYFFFGPIMTYDLFAEKRVALPQKSHVIRLSKKTLKTILGVVLLDFLLHFLHISSLAGDIQFLQSTPFYVVGFLLFSNILLDWAKAWILYQLTSDVANVIDGYSAAPRPPQCLATLTTFAETYFDRGIQHWLCRYIYDPLGEDHLKLGKEAFAAFITFAFVSAWQGPSIQVLIWAALNWFGLTFEFFVGSITAAKFKGNWRLRAFFLGLNYWCILIFNAVGISGIATAQVSTRLIFFNGNLLHIGIAVLLSYCYAAVVTMKLTKAKTQ